MKKNFNKVITLPLGQILDDFKIKRQSFYEINKKYKVFKREKHGYYSTTIQAYSQIKNYYQNKALLNVSGPFNKDRR